MKRRSSPPSSPERDEHPAIETFERVLTSGVMVDRGQRDQHRERWFDLSVAGLDLLAAESDSWTHPLPHPGRFKTPVED